MKPMQRSAVADCGPRAAAPAGLKILRRQPSSRGKNADPLGQRNQFCHGSDLHFLHHPFAVGLDRALRATQRSGGMLVGMAANDKLKDFPLARRQCRDISASHVQVALQVILRAVTRNRPLNCSKKLIGRCGLGQKILRTRLDAPHRGRNIGITSEEYNRQRRSEFAQATLKFWPAQSRYLHIEEDAAEHAIDGQAVQQMLSRSIDRDLVASLLQTTFYRRSERRIVIDDVHKPRQDIPRVMRSILPWNASYQLREPST